jgi:hypothetical protein
VISSNIIKKIIGLIHQGSSNKINSITLSYSLTTWSYYSTFLLGDCCRDFNRTIWVKITSSTIFSTVFVGLCCRPQLCAIFVSQPNKSKGSFLSFSSLKIKILTTNLFFFFKKKNHIYITLEYAFKLFKEKKKSREKSLENRRKKRVTALM